MARAALVAILVLVAGPARADDPFPAAVVSGHVFVVPGLSVRNGDWVAAEPSLWISRSLSTGWMVDVTDPTDSHVQAAIGFGF